MPALRAALRPWPPLSEVGRLLESGRDAGRPKEGLPASSVPNSARRHHRIRPNRANRRSRSGQACPRSTLRRSLLAYSNAKIRFQSFSRRLPPIFFPSSNGSCVMSRLSCQSGQRAGTWVHSRMASSCSTSLFSRAPSPVAVHFNISKTRRNCN
jgi:hypothetical protein